MFVGHFAIGLAIKAVNPKVSTLPIMIGVGLLDIIDGIFLIIGIDHATPNLLAGPFLFFDLDFVDWDHSFVTAICWSVLWGLLFFRNRNLAWLMGCAVFSHFFADLIVHNQDMALYPNSDTHWGFGLWGMLNTWSWVLEGIFAAILVIYASMKVSKFYMSLKWPAALMAVLFVMVSPWLSPMLKIAKLPNPKAQQILGLMLVISVILPSLLFSWLWKAADKKAGNNAG